MTTFPVDQQSADSEVFIGSKERPDNGYGQNGYQGASSVTDGSNPSANLLPKCVIKADDFQTRKVSANAYAPAHGMKKPSAPGGVVPANSRPVTKRG